MLYITLATPRSPPFSKAVGREPAWNFYGDKEVEIIAPAIDCSHLIAPMNCARFKFPNTVTIAGNGKVIIGGGGRRVEVYDYNTNRLVVSGGSVEDEWFYATATPLPDGRVFIAGGYNDSLHPTNQT